MSARAVKLILATERLQDAFAFGSLVYREGVATPDYGERAKGATLDVLPWVLAPN